MKRKIIIAAALLVIVLTGCVTDKYPNERFKDGQRGSQNQPWGDMDLSNPFPCHWRCSEYGKRLVEHNKRGDAFYKTNGIYVRP